MTKYEKLIEYANDRNISIVETYFESDSKGLCIGRDTIAIKKELKDCEKICILAEELGHYNTSVGDIVDQKNSNNQKQEKIARKWAVNKLIKIEKLIDAVKHGCDSLFEIADFLDVTEEFLIESIDIFRQKYGPCYVSGNYAVIFNDLGFSVTGLPNEKH
ncbi:MAG: ImmA/IrrE family metallo-endopeptidase [Candidatus Metalachnospira sp.]|nr:ImmA/IrrE family metallo-endopeptidase [Candidatus Metalachnospira sp.]